MQVRKTSKESSMLRSSPTTTFIKQVWGLLSAHSQPQALASPLHQSPLPVLWGCQHNKKFQRTPLRSAAEFGVMSAQAHSSICLSFSQGFFLVAFFGLVLLDVSEIIICRWVQPLNSSSSQLLQVCWFSALSNFLVKSLQLQVRKTSKESSMLGRRPQQHL